MNRLSVVLLALLVIATLGVVQPTIFGTATSQQTVQPNRVLERNANILMGRATPRPKQMFVSSGVMTAYMEGRAARSGAGRTGVGVRSSVSSSSVSLQTLGCANTFAGPVPNIRVNQDCTLRRQAEEAIAVNPLDPNNLIASQNDSRVGFNHCGTDFSLNRGGTWGDELPPFYQFIMGNGLSPDACSDPTMEFDSRGNAYFGGILFQINFAASAVVVTKSNAANKGSFWHSPAPGPFQEYSSNPLGVVASDNNPVIFHDKELMAVDSNPTSPKRDNVYMTWTRFNDATGAGVRQNSPIRFSQSTNGGATWSPHIEISGANAAICTIFSGSTNPNACDQDQGSHPFVAPNGDIHVVFGNGNTPGVGVNQVLHVSCPASANCAVASSWTAPTKVGDLIGTHPICLPPGCTNNVPGCPLFRQCIPPNGYRAPEFTGMTGNVHPHDSRVIFVTWWDTRNLSPNCTGRFETASPPCDTDVFFAHSNDGGATWGAAFNISDQHPDGDNATSQWQSWSAFGPDGTLYVAYYDRRYGNCETTGCHDITLAVSPDRGANFNFHRITTASMPNLTTANNPVQAGFLGD
ncbi:MAG: sialidase family protein, partial [bacterium]